MKTVISNIEFYQPAQGKPKHMFCSSTFLNILAYHNPFFKKPILYDLLRVGWTFWYSPKKRRLSSMYAKKGFLFNLNSLFSVNSESIFCSDLSHFRECLRERLIEKRPLYVDLSGVPVFVGEKLKFIDLHLKHFTYVVFGFDSKNDTVLLLTNGASKVGWAAISEVASRLKKNEIVDFMNPLDLQIPDEEKLVEFFLRKIRSNFKTYATLGTLRGINHYVWGNIARKSIPIDLPPVRILSGIGGIEKFSKDLVHLYGLERNEINDFSKHTCRKIIGFRDERAIFMRSLLELARFNKKDHIIKEIECLSQDLELIWVSLAKSFARVYMSEKKDSVDRIQEKLLNIKSQEKALLLLMQDFLKKEGIDGIESL